MKLNVFASGAVAQYEVLPAYEVLYRELSALSGPECAGAQAKKIRNRLVSTECGRGEAGVLGPSFQTPTNPTQAGLFQYASTKQGH